MERARSALQAGLGDKKLEGNEEWEQLPSSFLSPTPFRNSVTSHFLENPELS